MKIVNKQDILFYTTWFAVFYNIIVILWGAIVRITGAGAGCGEHWPLCDGQVIPLSFNQEKIIEFSHRITSSMSGILAIFIAILAFTASKKGHKIRKAATLSLIFTVLEGFVGGLQVLLGLTADSTDPARGIFQGIHLANTFVLLSAVFITALFASEIKFSVEKNNIINKKYITYFIIGGILLLVSGMSGAITALGDLLFKPNSNNPLETIKNDWALDSNFFERIRFIHPMIAILGSFYVGILAVKIKNIMHQNNNEKGILWSKIIMFIIVLQIFIGFLNVALKAPDFIQLFHLLIACLLWLAYCMLSYLTFSIKSN